MDVDGGILPQLKGNPFTAGATFSGPLLAGTIKHTSSAPGLAPRPAGLGNPMGLANVGYAEMGQSAVVTQAAAAAGTPIVIPAQSQILSMHLMVTTVWNGAATTVSIGFTGGGNAALVALTAAAALGQVALLPGAVAAAIALWDNIGNQDMQITVTSANAGTGVGTLTVRYLQGINMAS